MASTLNPDPFDGPGVGRALFEMVEGERKRLAEWYAEAAGILQSVASDSTSFLSNRAKACLSKKPFLDES